MPRRRRYPGNRNGGQMRLRPGHQCAYCGKTMLPIGTDSHIGYPHPDSATRDHVFPKSAGGVHTVFCCWACNNFKGSLFPGEWLAYVIEHMPSRADAVREVYRRFSIRWSEPAAAETQENENDLHDQTPPCAV